MLTSICLCVHNRRVQVHKVIQSILQMCRPPYEIIIVDDASTDYSIFDLLHKELQPLFGPAPKRQTGEFGDDDLRSETTFTIRYEKGGQVEDAKIRLLAYRNAANRQHATSQNISMDLARGEVLIHLEDDVVMPYEGWNQTFAKVLQDHPEVGMVFPVGSGRGEWIQRPGYYEFAWGLGGVWAVRKEVFTRVGGWDTTLVHQLEPDYDLRVRMDGWRLAGCLEVPQMHHLGEGDEQETFGRRLQITIGVYNFLKKWNARMGMGFFDYRSLWSCSWDDLFPNAAFRRQVAAALEQELTPSPEPFQFKGHWGKYELVKSIRPPGREREKELLEKMRSNFWFKGEPELHIQVLNLAKHMGVAEWQGFDMTTVAGVKAYLKGKVFDYEWCYQASPESLAEPSIHDPS